MKHGDTSKSLRNSLNRILSGKTFFVIAEMSEVKSISSAAIGELMGLKSSLVEKDGDLVLAGLSMDVKEILTALGAHKIFKFYKNVHAAASFYYWEFHNKIERTVVSFPSALPFVPPLRQMVRRIVKQKGYGEKDAFRIETIIDEICNNAVEHGSHQTEDNEIKLTVAIDQKKIEISVSNKIDPLKKESLQKIALYLANPKGTFHEIRGRGLALVKMLSNNFQINNSESGTCVQVTKYRED
jgi:anti-anti-sigma factor